MVVVHPPAKGEELQAVALLHLPLEVAGASAITAWSRTRVSLLPAGMTEAAKRKAGWGKRRLRARLRRSPTPPGGEVYRRKGVRFRPALTGGCRSTTPKETPDRVPARAGQSERSPAIDRSDQCERWRIMRAEAAGDPPAPQVTLAPSSARSAAPPGSSPPRRRSPTPDLDAVPMPHRLRDRWSRSPRLCRPTS